MMLKDTGPYQDQRLYLHVLIALSQNVTRQILRLAIDKVTCPTTLAIYVDLQEHSV